MIPGRRGGLGRRKAEDGSRKAGLFRRSGLGHELLDFRHQSWSVVGDAVFDGPFDTAGVHGLAVADFVDSRGVKHLQVFERVAVDDEYVGHVAGADAAEARLLAQYARVVAGGVLNHFEWLKTGLLLQFQLANQTEAVHLIDEAGIVSTADEAAALL